MWVDFTDIDSAITMTKPSTIPTQMRTSQSPTIQTEIAFTGINFSVSQNTSLEKEISQGTTLRTEVSSPDQTSRINRRLQMQSIKYNVYCICTTEDWYFIMV